MLMQFKKHLADVFSKSMCQPVGMVALITKVSQSFNAQKERGFKHLPFKAIHLAVQELIGMLLVDCPGQNFQMGIVTLGQVNNLQ